MYILFIELTLEKPYGQYIPLQYLENGTFKSYETLHSLFYQTRDGTSFRGPTLSKRYRYLKINAANELDFSF